MLLLLTQAFLEMFVPCCLATASVGTFLSVCSTRCSSFVESCCCAIFFPSSLLCGERRVKEGPGCKGTMTRVSGEMAASAGQSGRVWFCGVW